MHRVMRLVSRASCTVESELERLMGSTTLAAIADFCVIAFLASLSLFVVEVFVKGREKPGQVLGLCFAVIGFVVFLATYSDRLPSHPDGLRDLVDLFPDTGGFEPAFTSSGAALVALAAVFVLRTFIYVRYFVYPALTLSDEEYNTPERLEERANDFTAPILAYVGFAIVAASLVVGVYGLSWEIGVLIFVLLELSYFFSRIFHDLTKYLRRLIVELRVLLRNVWNYINDVVIIIIIILGRLERWRTRRPTDDEEEFRAALQRRLRASRQKTVERNTRDRERLRKLTEESESDEEE